MLLDLWDVCAINSGERLFHLSKLRNWLLRNFNQLCRCGLICCALKLRKRLLRNFNSNENLPAYFSPPFVNPKEKSPPPPRLITLYIHF